MTEVKIEKADKGFQFFDARIKKPPLGTKLLLLTKGRICTIGCWDTDCLGWQYLPSIPESLKR